MIRHGVYHKNMLILLLGRGGGIVSTRYVQDCRFSSDFLIQPVANTRRGHHAPPPQLNNCNKPETMIFEYGNLLWLCKLKSGETCTLLCILFIHNTYYNILFLTREDKSHIFKPPCNVLFII